jgi:hypothetical protein
MPKPIRLRPISKKSAATAYAKISGNTKMITLKIIMLIPAKRLMFFPALLIELKLNVFMVL